MRYMLDTNIVSHLLRNPAGAAAHRAREAGDDVCISIVVAAELRYGAAKKASAALTRRVDEFLREVPILPLDVPADAEYGRLRAQLERAGTPIGSNDLLIASHAAALGATVVTANVNEFRRIPALAVENWLEVA